jgi:hypothetical protein
MLTKNKSLRTFIPGLTIILILACNLGNPRGVETPESSAEETESALKELSTSLANEQLTLQALQTQMADQLQPTLPPAETSAPPPSPTQPAPPTQTSIPTQTSPPTPGELVLSIQTSVKTFYCYQPPYELTITVKVSDINRGMAVYYHIQDKASGTTSEYQVLDLRRKDSSTRSVTIIGGGSMDQNLQFPPLMGESYFIFQIISDDGSYRSEPYSDVTFFPCAQ